MSVGSIQTFIGSILFEGGKKPGGAVRFLVGVLRGLWSSPLPDCASLALHKARGGGPTSRDTVQGSSNSARVAHRMYRDNSR